MEAKEGEIMGMVNPDSKSTDWARTKDQSQGKKILDSMSGILQQKAKEKGSNGSQYGMTLQTIPLS